MQSSSDFVHGQWSSKIAFILATMGAAVGLGNIWRFPYITGENGGGAFVLLYLACIVFIGLPLMMTEVMLGRRGRQSPTHSLAKLAGEAGAGQYWKYVGGLGILAGFLIVTYYHVVAGQVTAYIFTAGSGAFKGATPDAVAALFTNLTSDPWRLMFWGALFMALNAYALSHRLDKGLERAMNFMMPAMLLIMGFMVIYAMTSGAFMRGVIFLFKPDFSKIQAETVLIALGQAFFSLGISLGTLLTFGAYLPKRMSILQTTSIVAFADTFVAIMAGLAIFPIVFAYGLEPGQGPSLIFNTLPLAFGAMPMGTIIGTLFFIMLFFAAFSSSLALVEPAIAWLQEKTGMRRAKVAYLVCGASWVLGLGSVLSYNVWEKSTLFFGRNFMGFIDYVTANYMLTLGGILLAVFATWVLKKEAAQDELELSRPWLFTLWRVLTRFVCPLVIGVIFINSIA